MACISCLELCCEGPWLQAYRKMDVTRERIIRILELREILLSFQTGFNLVSTAVVCAIVESISGLEPSSVITETRYLKLVTVSNFCPFTLISVLMPLVLSSAWSSQHWSPCRRLWRLCQGTQLFCQFFFLSCYVIDVISKAEIGGCSASNADSAFGIF